MVNEPIIPDSSQHGATARKYTGLKFPAALP
jgi:hypothetical protein